LSFSHSTLEPALSLLGQEPQRAGPLVGQSSRRRSSATRRPVILLRTALPPTWTASREDRDVTRRLSEAGGIPGIDFVDHVISVEKEGRYTASRSGPSYRPVMRFTLS
jgi:hypothetical protein